MKIKSFRLVVSLFASIVMMPAVLAAAAETISVEIVLATVSRQLAEKAGLKPEMDGGKAAEIIKSLDKEDKLAHYTRLWTSTTESEESLIQFGKRVNVPAGSFSSARGGVPSRTFRAESVGTLLRVKPTRDGNKIHVELNFEQSKVSKTEQDEGGVDTITIQSKVSTEHGIPAIVGGRFDGKRNVTYVILTSKMADASLAQKQTSVPKRVYFLKYVKAEDAARELKVAFSKQAVTVGVNERTNAIVVSGDKKQLERFEEALAILDKQ